MRERGAACRRGLLVVLALALASAAPLQAAEVGSTELIRQCKYPRQGKRTIGENADALQCLRYVEGFVAGASIVAGPRRSARPQVRNIDAPQVGRAALYDVKRTDAGRPS